MKKTLVALAVVVSIALLGCGSQPMQDAKTEEAEVQADQVKADDERDAVVDYLNREEMRYPVDIYNELGELIDAVTDGDVDAATELRDSIQDKANAVLLMEDVPLAATDFHYEASMACTSYESAAEYLCLSLLSPSDATEYTEMATEALEAGGEHFDNLNVELESLQDEVGI